MQALSIVGGDTFALISRDNLARPRYGVTDPYARRLRSRPQLQVLWPIVIPYAIAVMNGLFREKEPSQDFLHHENVLENVVALARSRMPWRPGQHVPGLVPRAAALPSPVRSPSHTAAGRARSRFLLLGLAAGTEIARPARWTAQMPTGWLISPSALSTNSPVHDLSISNLRLISACGRERPSSYRIRRDKSGKPIPKVVRSDREMVEVVITDRKLAS